ncbi:MAG: LacI family transcriptional regulator [Sporolactobacillus sp.]|nr:LacI family transcriptional regulator [Sporolactobacillus sp.]
MVTINDVAKRANVSKSTVSNVFSKKKMISKELTERILRAAKELNYMPNYFAKTLATKQSKVIGLTVNDQSWADFHQNIMKGILSVCNNRNYYLLIKPFAREDHAFFPTDGEIILNPEENKAIFCDSREQKQVWVGMPPSGVPGPQFYVDNDNEQIGRMVTDFLIRQGLKHIFYLNAPVSRTFSRKRKTGFLRSVVDHHLEEGHYDHFYLPEDEDPQRFGFIKAGQLIDQVGVEPCAFIVDTDYMAQGVYHACYKRQKNIPVDVSVLAICAGINTSEVFQPPLSFVELNEFKLGKEAANLLIGLIEHLNQQQLMNKRIESSIHVKGSTRLIDGENR